MYAVTYSCPNIPDFPPSILELLCKTSTVHIIQLIFIQASQEVGDYLCIRGNNIAGFKLRVERVECGWRARLVVRACNGSVGHACDNEQDGKAHDEVDG